MNITKVGLEAVLVAIWAIYVVIQVLSSAAGGADGGADPTGGTGLLVGFLGSLPVEAIVLPTAVMAGVFIAIEVVFAALRRAGGPTGRQRR